jgi:hypothetical protein
VNKERFRELALWALLGLSGLGAGAANIGGAAMAERVARLEAAETINGGRLQRIEEKIDRLMERGK